MNTRENRVTANTRNDTEVYGMSLDAEISTDARKTRRRQERASGKISTSRVTKRLT